MNVTASKTIKEPAACQNNQQSVFFSLVGPPQAKFEPAKYVKEWLNCHRNADDMRGSKVAENIIRVAPLITCNMIVQHGPY